MTGQARPSDGDQDDGIGEALRMLTQARKAMDAASVACGIDPESGVLVDPERCTPENRRRLAEVAERMIRPAALKALEAVK